MSDRHPIPLYLVDAFAERPFAGNVAAICLVDHWPADEWMQQLAAELQHSESAFVRPDGEDFALRWFTPAVEVDLCGHATLAASHVLWQTGRVAAGRPIRFSTRSGILTARPEDGQIGLDFPLDPQAETAPPPGLLAALGGSAKYVGKGRFDYLIELGSEDEVRALVPDFGRLAEVECRGVIVTAPAAGEPYDFVSRFFAPAAGVNEDPVTGSAHCTLAHFWHGRLGKASMRAYQASRRGGAVGVRVDGDRVHLLGTAVLVFEGQLTATPG